MQWTRFSREFSQFLVAVSKSAESDQTKLATFLRLVGPRGNDLYETMRFEEGEDKTKWSVVSAKFATVCGLRTSKHVLRDNFFQLKQEGKSIDQFVMELRKKAHDCEFGVLQDDLMLNHDLPPRQNSQP